MIVLVAQRQPFLDRNRQRFRVIAIEIKGVVSRHLSKDRNVTRNNRQLMLSRLDERQAEAFPFGSRDQTSTRGVNLVQILIADAVEPKQASVQFGVRAEPIDEALHHPALLADDDEIEIVVILPKRFECLQNLRMGFPRFSGAYHQKGVAIRYAA